MLQLLHLIRQVRADVIQLVYVVLREGDELVDPLVLLVLKVVQRLLPLHEILKLLAGRWAA
eukprot:CAMPEP_0168473822 /NCGR_PEP_ID=MMETSP0228-20121227/60521_1 /TAXON_ID=133427 /ORGANISM="Protoceratium reticulatum, Strain CCCM 535 (=CCMP 1889)" /LENGTH=60 /DNA_ID=CAMNT_0008489825 /DNA_START=63 /DNA_END=241 /DNA_ORIENTATION=-